ncbi:MAG: GNAT family N-acetyltransferase [Clostridia bacterium]|nr:GNAT family N-acetyltransferase [Clostridia bacterium]
MAQTLIKRLDTDDPAAGRFIHEAFTEYGIKNGVTLNYDEFCFVAEDPGGQIIGAVTGWAYYDEVHIGDLIVAESYRNTGMGSRLVRAAEDAYRGKGYSVVTLSTFGFQAPGFYKKLGYEIEFVRGNSDPRLVKYFLKKQL